MSPGLGFPCHPVCSPHLGVLHGLVPGCYPSVPLSRHCSALLRIRLHTWALARSPERPPSEREPFAGRAPSNHGVPLSGQSFTVLLLFKLKYDGRENQSPIIAIATPKPRAPGAAAVPRWESEPAGWEVSRPGLNCVTLQFASLRTLSASFITASGKHIMRTYSYSPLFSLVASPGPVAQHRVIIVRDPPDRDPVMLWASANISRDSVVWVHVCAFLRAFHIAGILACSRVLPARGPGASPRASHQQSRRRVQWKGRCCMQIGKVPPSAAPLRDSWVRFNSRNTSGGRGPRDHSGSTLEALSFKTC